MMSAHLMRAIFCTVKTLTGACASTSRATRCLFVPDVDVTHYQGFSSKQRPVRVMWHMHKGMMRFYNKFFLRRYPWPLVIVVALGVWFRFLALVFSILSQPLLTFSVEHSEAYKRFFVSSAESNLDPSFLQFRLNELSSKGRVLVLGARSQVGHFLIPRLINSGYPVTATSRKKVQNPAISELEWQELNLESEEELILPNNTETVISLAPLWLLRY